MEELTAKISGIVMSNRHTGFHILRVTPDGMGAGVVSVLGTFPGVAIGVGLRAKFQGKFETHDKYGRQLRASTCEVIPDKGRNGVVTYLSANVPSIGPITAARLYDTYGDELLEILEKTPNKILECAFLNKTQAQAIIKEWSEASETRLASIQLSEFGLTSTQIKSVITKFGVTEGRKIAVEDPYRLSECAGVSFMVADQVARKAGVGVDDQRRMDAIVMFAMSELSHSEGHLYVTRPEIRTFMRKRLFNKYAIERFSYGEEMSETHFLTALVALQHTNKVYSEGDALYLGHHWRDETEASKCVAEMALNGPLGFQDLDGAIAEFEKLKNVELSDEQRQALQVLGESRLLVVSGYPGTGKTMLISAFVHLLEKANLDYFLMSPTGIAAKRLSQMTGKPASTIHRALGYKGDTWEFNESNKFVVDAVVVDEMSMVDASIFYKLVSSLLPTTLLIMVGDPAQLPSVGAGYVLNSLMKCVDVPHVGLTRIYRQEKASDINLVAHAILKNEPVDTTFKPGSQFLFLNYPEEQDAIAEVRKITNDMKNRAMNFQVIAPVYDGELGVDNLNRELRGVLNDQVAKARHGVACDEAWELAAENDGLDKSGAATPTLLAHIETVTGKPVVPSKEIFSKLTYDEVHSVCLLMKPDISDEHLKTAGSVPFVGSKDSPLFYEGDRVMIIRNNYEKMVFNGDVGKVHRISLKDNEVEVKVFNWLDQDSKTTRWTDKIFTFTVEEAKSILKVAYACTAHKVQGQEFDYVILPMTSAYGIMLYKNLVYTAVTRAKKKVFIFGDSKAFLSATRNNRETSRNTLLHEFISRELVDLREEKQSA